MGSLAARVLQKAETNQAGDVVAAFPNSFYMKTTERELIFVTNRHLKSPITINVDATSNWGQLVKPHEAVSVRKNEIRIGESATIRVGDALTLYEQPPLARPLTPQISVTQESLLLASLILTIVDNRLSILDPSGIAHRGAIEFVQAGVIPLRQSVGEERFRDAARNVVGLGGGFTPSGDDMLGGFLATYNSVAQVIDRPRLLFRFDLLENKTSWISAKLLDYMQRQVLDEQVDRLIGAAVTGDTDTFITFVEALLPRGHTSGIDILVGTIFALSLTQDIVANTRNTEAFASRLGLRY